MKYSTYFYYADYEIIESNGIKYIHCPKPVKELDAEYRFDTKANTKKLIKALLALDLENEQAILDFTSEYGLLVNTQNDPEHPTYCGHPVPQKINELLSPAKTGFSMPLHLFKYYIELIRNILHLSTEISLFDRYGKKGGISADENYDCAENIHHITKYFLSLLYQPYATMTTMIGGINFVFDGNTPLSRFAFNYHELQLSFLIPRPINCIQQYNHSMMGLCSKNKDLLQEFYVCMDNGTITYESDIPRITLGDKINMAYTISREDYETFILSDDFYNNSPPERKLSLLSVRDTLKKHFDTTNADKISFSMAHPLAFKAKYKDKFTTPVSDTVHYENILKELISLEKYFDFYYHNSTEIEVTLKNNSEYDEVLSFIEGISTTGKQLLTETINSFTTNVNYRMYLDEKGSYQTNLVSGTLLQGIFFKMADLLNSYDVTICKYRHCKNPVFSLKSRPAKCCCHTHLTSYLRYKERHS